MREKEETLSKEPEGGEGRGDMDRMVTTASSFEKFLHKFFMGRIRIPIKACERLVPVVKSGARWWWWIKYKRTSTRFSPTPLFFLRYFFFLLLLLFPRSHTIRACTGGRSSVCTNRFRGWPKGVVVESITDARSFSRVKHTRREGRR